MTIYINPFILGVICTIVAEILAFILTVMFYVIRHSARKRRNASNSSRRENNE